MTDETRQSPSKTDARATSRMQADDAMSIMEGLADKWSAEVDLPSIIKNAVSPARLSRNAPDDVRERFIGRMEAQIDAIVRQAFIEGSYRAITGLQDERKAMAKLRRSHKKLSNSHRPAKASSR
jgi:hypothetical protein